MEEKKILLISREENFPTLPSRPGALSPHGSYRTVYRARVLQEIGLFLQLQLRLAGFLQRHKHFNRVLGRQHMELQYNLIPYLKHKPTTTENPKPNRKEPVLECCAWTQEKCMASSELKLDWKTKRSIFLPIRQ